jgi:putative ABC transport system permease protein
LHDKTRFVVTVAGVAFAVFLTVFQGSLLAGFVRAASINIDATESDIWLTPRGVSCFEFATPLPARYVEISQGVPGVIGARRMVLGYAQFRKHSGASQLVLLIGADAGIGTRFPIPVLNKGQSNVQPNTLVIDETNRETLEIASIPTELEINSRRATVVLATKGFGSFFGAPYVYTGFSDAANYLRTPPEQVSFVVLRVGSQYSISNVKHELQKRLPDIDVWTREEFATRSQTFWVLQTGAGGAILTAAVLGLLVGFVLVSQNMYATTMEKLDEFATLKALGGSSWFVRRVVIEQALICGLLGSAIGSILAVPGIAVAQQSISWIFLPVWLPYIMATIGTAMSLLASLASIRKALSSDPARVFRA